MPSPSSTTGMGVYLRNISTIKLSCVGSRWGMRTKAMPLSAGMAVKNFLKASSPPAEAPMPTTGKRGAVGSLISVPASSLAASSLGGASLGTSAGVAAVFAADSTLFSASGGEPFALRFLRATTSSLELQADEPEGHSYLYAEFHPPHWGLW